ncbi:MAG: hypothetical protein WCK77_14985 [Verrucomicrobiota bacterium]
MNRLLVSLFILAGPYSHVLAADQPPPLAERASQPAMPQAGKVITVTDFGLKPDSKLDAVTGLRAAIEACRKEAATTLVFPKGRYDFWPEHSERIEYFESNTSANNPKICPVVLKGLGNLTIEGNGSQFVCHGRMQPLTLEKCGGVTVRNLDIDWDIPFVAQAKIIAVKADSIMIKINPMESPYDIENGKIVFRGEGWKSEWWGCIEFDAQTRIIPQQSGDSPLGGNWDKYTAQDQGDGLMKLSYAFERKPKPGNILIMRHSTRDHAGVFIFNCKDTVLENCNLFAAAGLGILAQFSENVALIKTNVMPNDAKGRYQCGHADGFQVSNCRGKVIVDGCKFQGLMDDPINVHGTSVKIVERKDSTHLLCRFMEGMSTGMTWGRPGERIGFIEHASMATLGQGTIRSYSRIDRDNFEIELAAAVPAQLVVGNALENLTWVPDFTVRDTLFGSCRARSLLVSTPGRVVIENNDFVSSGAAILIAGDANHWYESGAVSDVVIRGNRFHPSCLTSWFEFGEGIISICPIIPKLDPGKPFHHNIRIENNRFDGFDYPLLYARSVDGLAFRDNSIRHNTLYQPWQGRKSMLTFEGCKAVEVSGNQLADDVLGKNISTVRMNASEVGVAPGQGIVPPVPDGPVAPVRNAAGRLIPPMGWNSYTGYSIAVTEDELLKNIDFLSEKLAPYGYDTVTVDNGWFLSGKGEGITIKVDAYGRPESHEHFFPRGLKYTIDHAHAKGIKFGIWLLRGINRRAVDENLPVEGTTYHMQDIVDRKSVCPWAAAPWWNYGVDMAKPGAQQYYDGLVKKYADMGVDFIKFDDIVPNPAEVDAVVKAIAKCGRRIVLSLSPGDDVKVEHSTAYLKANMVRVTSDIWDNRGSLDGTFQRWESLQAYEGPKVGSWLDMDMICFGRLTVTDNGGRDCQFTEDQKRTFMVQRAMAASPLMLGGVLYSMDEFSMGLFTHSDILECDRNGVIGQLVHRAGKLDVWNTAGLENPKNGWLGIFNRDTKATTVTLGLKDLGLNAGGKYSLCDLWTKDHLPVSDDYRFEIPADGVAFLRYHLAE